MNDKEIRLLSDLLDYRILTPELVSEMGYGVEKTGKRLLESLRRKGYVAILSVPPSGKKGRPYTPYTLTPSGAEWLRVEAGYADRIRVGGVVWKDTNRIEHQLLLNRVAIYFRKLGEEPGIQVDFLLSKSALVPSASKIIRIPVETDSQTEGAGSLEEDFAYPDAVVTVSRANLETSLLFFVEMDAGTETLRSGTGLYPSIEGKIQAYQLFLVGQEYKSYEKNWSVSFRGFRVLFVTENQRRADQIARVVSKMTHPNKPWVTDFVWITTIDRMKEEGIAAPIWMKGGDSISKYSILRKIFGAKCDLDPGKEHGPEDVGNCVQK